MTLPLHGVRVLDLSHVIAGPMASFYLAQLGADVIKVESPEAGDVMRASKSPDGAAAGDTPSPFTALNAGKRSLAIDIRTPEGAAQVRALARTADVFIENFRPGVVARHGLDEAAIRAERPDIVYCSISAFGQQGEWSGRGAYDHVVQALTGMMMMSGDREDAPPLKVGFPVIDVAAGMLGALSVVSALFRRLQNGQGACIDTSMVQASLMLMYPNASTYLTHRTQPADATGSESEPMVLRDGSSPARDKVEALAFLTAPATVTIRVGGATTSCDLPAGIGVCLAPLGTGGVSATVKRDGGTVTSIASPFTVTASPDVQDLQYVGISSAR